MMPNKGIDQATKDKMNGLWTKIAEEIQSARDNWSKANSALKAMGEHNEQAFELMVEVAEQLKALSKTLEAERTGDEVRSE